MGRVDDELSSAKQNSQVDGASQVFQAGGQAVALVAAEQGGVQGMDPQRAGLGLLDQEGQRGVLDAASQVDVELIRLEGQLDFGQAERLEQAQAFDGGQRVEAAGGDGQGWVGHGD